MNSFENKTKILAELWLDYRDEKEFKDFIEYNDMGMPLAYFINYELVTPTEQAKLFVEETYLLLLAAVGAEDKEFDSLNSLFQNLSSE